MPRYFYIARDTTGKKDVGFEDASSQDELISRLQQKDLLVVEVMLESEYREGAGKAKLESITKVKFKTQHYRITNNDLVIFCRQLATLLGAGITILNSLNIIAQQVSSRKLNTVIRELQKGMEAGLSFHEAMAKFPDIFSELWVNLAESGESSGNLAAVLSRLAGYLERNAAFRRKIVSALVYPCVLMLAGLSALLFLTLKVIPTFAEIFQGVGLTLPLLTRILLVISGLIRKYIFLAFGILGVGAYVLRRYTRTKKGKRNFELFLFRLPLFGEFFRILVVERFTAEMATLLESGVPILYSLDITEKSVGNLVLADIIRKIKENVRQGKPLSKPMEESGFFELMSVQMVAVGEEIGELPDMFKRLNAFYDEYLETFLNRFTTLFEPVMLVVMGIAIGILVLGMYLPIFDIAKIGKALSG